jgi:hypothetical protein
MIPDKFKKYIEEAKAKGAEKKRLIKEVAAKKKMPAKALEKLTIAELKKMKK